MSRVPENGEFNSLVFEYFFSVFITWFYQSLWGEYKFESEIFSNHTNGFV